MQFTARLLRSIWNRGANDVFLIGTRHLDLNDVEIRAEVQRVFNARLKEHDLATGTWKVGDNPVDRLLGKELCVRAEPDPGSARRIGHGIKTAARAELTTATTATQMVSGLPEDSFRPCHH